MTASLLCGKTVSTSIKTQILSLMSKRRQQGRKTPLLAVILVGGDPASEIYVANKKKACAEIGFGSESHYLDDNISEEELINLIEKLNANDSVNGILLQLPLPSHIKASKVLEHISPLKDVDGFHPYNFGRLSQGNPLIRPCTPKGIMSMLEYFKIDVKGQHAVVVGASKIVGRPMAAELIKASATVTVCHRSTTQLKKHIEIADIIVVATGFHNVVPTEWLKSHQIIIDVGIHRDEHGKLRGDMAFQKAQEIVSWITPVPGGVGPMTIATLLQNTLQATELQENLD